MSLIQNIPDFNGRIIHELAWTELCLVAWGGLRVGGAVTVHMPKELMWNGGGGMAATAHCMPNAGLCATWTYRFGVDEWEGSLLCRRCFDWKKQKPKPTARPGAGFYAYGRTPKDEQVFKTQFKSMEERRIAVVSKILALNRYDVRPGDEEEVSNRIVEV